MKKQTIIITGASSGIGKEVAKYFLTRGDNVVINSTTPEKLKQYGLGYLGTASTPDFSVWQLAVGPDKDIRAIANFFGLQYQTDENDKTQINHSLVTAVISPEGKVTKIFNGNDWTPGDLLRELKATLPQNE